MWVDGLVFAMSKQRMNAKAHAGDWHMSDHVANLNRDSLCPLFPAFGFHLLVLPHYLHFLHHISVPQEEAEIGGEREKAYPISESTKTLSAEALGAI